MPLPKGKDFVDTKSAIDHSVILQKELPVVMVRNNGEKRPANVIRTEMKVGDGPVQIVYIEDLSLLD